MSRIEEVLKQLPVDVGSIMCGVGWGHEQLPFGITYDGAQMEAQRKVDLDILAAGPEAQDDPLRASYFYARRLWHVIFYLAALYENKDYRKQESGLLNCQSAVFYLDTVVKNFAEMEEALRKTGEKLAPENAARTEKCTELAELMDKCKDTILDFRRYINREL